MQTLVNLQLVPIGTEVSVSRHISACLDILDAAGLRYELHANGTNIEGEWDAVFAAIRHCHEVLHARGVPRIQTFISVGTRTDRPQSLQDKVASVSRHRSAD